MYLGKNMRHVWPLVLKIEYQYLIHRKGNGHTHYALYIIFLCCRVSCRGCPDKEAGFSHEEVKLAWQPSYYRLQATSIPSAQLSPLTISWPLVAQLL